MDQNIPGKPETNTPEVKGLIFLLAERPELTNNVLMCAARNGGAFLRIERGGTSLYYKVNERVYTVNMDRSSGVYSLGAEFESVNAYDWHKYATEWEHDIPAVYGYCAQGKSSTR